MKESSAVKKYPSQKQKIIAYVLTMLLRACSSSLAGVIGRTKKPMDDEIGLSQSFLGTMSSMLYIGKVLGSIFLLLNPIQKLKLTLFLCFTGLIISISLIPLTGLIRILPEQSIWVGCFLAGFCRSFMITTYFIMKQNIGTSKSMQNLASLWVSTSYLGDIAGLLFTERLITNAGLSWQLAFLVNLSIYLVFDALMLVFVDEIQITNEREEGRSQKCCQFITFIKQYYHNAANILHSLSFVFIDVIYAVILLEMPHYFMAIGFSSPAAYISILMPASYMLGNFIYTYSAGHRLKVKSLGPINFCILVIVAIIMFVLAQLRNDPSQIPLYSVLVFFLGFTIAGPAVNTFNRQVDVRCENSYERSFIMNFNNLALQVCTSLVFLVTGFLFERNLYSFFWILFSVSMLNVLVYGVRVYNYPQEFVLIDEQRVLEVPDEEQY